MAPYFIAETRNIIDDQGLSDDIFVDLDVTAQCRKNAFKIYHIQNQVNDVPSGTEYSPFMIYCIRNDVIYVKRLLRFNFSPAHQAELI